MSVTPLPVGVLSVDPCNPRSSVGDVTDLAASIGGQGVLTPLVVRPGEGGFSVVRGSRRLEAARQAGLSTVPCDIRDLDDRAAAIVAACDHVSAAALNPIDEARAYLRLVEDHGMTQLDVARALGVSHGTVNKRIQLLKLPEGAQRAVAAGTLPLSTAYRNVKDPQKAYGRARHGTRARYASGCDCNPCRDANTRRTRSVRHGPEVDLFTASDRIVRLAARMARLRGLTVDVWVREAVVEKAQREVPARQEAP